MVFPLILGLLLSIVALVFAFQNAQIAHISFIVWHFDSSLALVLVICFAAGLLAGILMVLPGRIRSALANSKSRREVATLEGELADCRGKLMQLEAATKEAIAEASPSEEGAASET
jgi:uncharacterized integral membrane protein